MAQAPAAMTNLGSPTASYVINKASRIFRVTGPVTRIIGVSRRGDELDAEPAGIEDDIAQRVGLDLAAVAAAGADLAQSQRAAEQPLQFAVERGDFRHLVAGGDKLAAPRGGQPPIARERDAVPRAPRFAIAAEDASAEVDLRPRVRDRKRAGRA